MAIVPIMAVKEGVRLSSIQSEKVHIGRRLLIDNWVKQARLSTRKKCIFCWKKKRKNRVPK